MEHGPVERNVLEQCLRSNMPIPAKIAAGEYLDEALTLFYNAFCDLSAERSSDGGELLPIPWSAVNLWCNEYGLTGEDKQEVIDVVRLVDLEYLKWVADRKEAARGRAARKRRRGAKRGNLGDQR